MVVHDNAVTGFYEMLGKDVFTSTALMCGKQIFDAEEFFELIAHTVECFASCVSIVGTEHSGLHIVAHGIDAGVGQHIHEDIAVMKKECIKARILHLFQTFARNHDLIFF